MSTDLSQRASSRLQTSPVSQEQRTQEAKEAFQASFKSSGAAIDHELQERAKIIHANAKELDKQDKQVKKDTKQLNKESDAVEKFLTKSRKALPDMDSFEAEMAKIEADLDMFDEMLDDVERSDYESETEGDPGHSPSVPAGEDPSMAQGRARLRLRSEHI